MQRRHSSTKLSFAAEWSARSLKTAVKVAKFNEKSKIKFSFGKLRRFSHGGLRLCGQIVKIGYEKQTGYDRRTCWKSKQFLTCKGQSEHARRVPFLYLFIPQNGGQNLPIIPAKNFDLYGRKAAQKRSHENLQPLLDARWCIKWTKNPPVL